LGYFSTYQKIAEVLGSPRGQQGVAKSLRVHDCELDTSNLNVNCSNDVHCYRVINSDFSVGGYVFDDKGEQIRAKVNMLRKEGINIIELGKKKYVVDRADRKKMFTSFK